LLPLWRSRARRRSGPAESRGGEDRYEAQDGSYRRYGCHQQARTGARDARLAAVRAAAEADAAQRRGQHDEAARQQALAASYRAMHDAYTEREATFASSWPTGPTGTPPPATSGTSPWPLTPSSAAATPAGTTRRCAPPSPRPPPKPSAPDLPLTAGEQIPQTAQWIKDLAVQRRAFADRLADRQSLTIPAEDPDYGDLGQAFPPWPAPARDAILQPPKPEIQPSERILERALERDLDMEAAD
jgi:hypothetical protein